MSDIAIVAQFIFIGQVGDGMLSELFAAAVPPPFRLTDPALCGSRPLVTPYYCRLGDLLCFVFIV